MKKYRPDSKLLDGKTLEEVIPQRLPIDDTKEAEQALETQNCNFDPPAEEERKRKEP